MKKYAKQTRILAAVDCIIFGFDGYQLKVLLVKRDFEPEKGKWSLMGGFVGEDESPDDAAIRVLRQLTGLNDVYMEQMQVFGKPDRDPIERTISITYFALLDIKKYNQCIDDQFVFSWFPLKEIPPLIFDHDQMIERARLNLRYKASLHPILFELLPAKFTLTQVVDLFEDVFNVVLDKRNFNRKLSATGLLVKQKDKDKFNSKKGAFYFKLNIKVYKDKFRAFLNLVPNSVVD